MRNPSTRVKIIELPGYPLARGVDFDIGWADDRSRSYYLADRANARIAVIDMDRAEYSHSLGEGHFTGVSLEGRSGPNGVTVLQDRQEAWAGDGDSTMKAFYIGSGERLASIDTGGSKRVDELAYDWTHDLVLGVNDQEPVPFATIVSTASKEIVAKVPFPWATNGIHQPVWDPNSGRFYVPIAEVNGDKRRGEIVALDPITGHLESRYPVADCQPAGIALGPPGELCIGCGKAAVLAGFPPTTLVMSLESGEIVASIADVGGTDEVWYDPLLGRYLLAAAWMRGGAVLGVVDARTRRWIANIPTSPDSHSVAADPRANQIFVPITANADAPIGGIAVLSVDHSPAEA